MPSSPNYVRDYKQEAKTAKKRGEDKGKAQRGRARRKALKCGMVVKPNQDVDHKKPISKGGTNDCSNLEVTSKKKNRSFKRKSDGSIA